MHTFVVYVEDRTGVLNRVSSLFRRRGYSIDIVQFPETDFAAIARGPGARGMTVRTLADLEPLRAWVAEGAPGVMVVDGKIDPNLEADWHAEHFP